MMQQSLIIVAAGSGTRMGGDIPKQFIPLEGKPILLRTIDRFRTALESPRIIIVLARQMKAHWNQAISRFPGYDDVQIAPGGDTRFASVKNGLSMVSGQEIIGVHDAVRPLVSRETILNAYQAAEEFGSAVPVIAPGESVRLVNSGGNASVNRNTVRLVQTPQVFRSDLLKKAYALDYEEAFTDDASVFEKMHGEIHLVEGNRENIKITFPEDLHYAEMLLKNKTF